MQLATTWRYLRSFTQRANTGAPCNQKRNIAFVDVRGGMFPNVQCLAGAGLLYAVVDVVSEFYYGAKLTSCQATSRTSLLRTSTCPLVSRSTLVLPLCDCGCSTSLRVIVWQETILRPLNLSNPHLPGACFEGLFAPEDSEDERREGEENTRMAGACAMGSTSLIQKVCLSYVV